MYTDIDRPLNFALDLALDILRWYLSTCIALADASRMLGAPDNPDENHNMVADGYTGIKANSQKLEIMVPSGVGSANKGFFNDGQGVGYFKQGGMTGSNKGRH